MDELINVALTIDKVHTATESDQDCRPGVSELNQVYGTICSLIYVRCTSWSSMKWRYVYISIKHYRTSIQIIVLQHAYSTVHWNWGSGAKVLKLSHALWKISYNIRIVIVIETVWALFFWYNILDMTHVHITAWGQSTPATTENVHETAYTICLLLQ